MFCPVKNYFDPASAGIIVPMLPSIPIPEPLRGLEPDTFSERTVTQRIPAIGRRALAESSFAPETAARLSALFDDLPFGRIRPLVEQSTPDLASWQAYIRPYEGQTWLEAPLFFVETYFYRRILEASGYFQPGPGLGVDPFAYQKSQGMLQARQALAPFEPELQPEALQHPVNLGRLLRLDLWGNQADLSMWPAGGEKNAPSGGRDEHLLCDDVQGIVTHLQSHPGRVEIVLDNTGAELAFDLLLVDGLLRCGAASEVRLWAKVHPTFVSDAIPGDIRLAVADLLAHGGPGVQAMAKRLHAYQAGGRLQITSDYYWNSPLAGWEMPDNLRRELAGAALVLSKGDANYRRWLGDRHWAYDAPLQDVLAYTPAPLGLLRVLKCEVGAGMPEEIMARAAALDPGWLTNGKWGVIQFADDR
jgi:hypothetical protein